MISSPSPHFNAERGAFFDLVAEKIHRVTAMTNPALRKAQLRGIRNRLEAFRAYRVAIQGADCP